MTYATRIALSSALDTRAREIVAATYPNFTPSTSAYREVLQLHYLRIYVETLSLAEAQGGGQSHHYAPRLGEQVERSTYVRKLVRIMPFYRFLLIVALAWVAAVFIDAAVDHPAPHVIFPTPPESAPYIQPHHH